jgi:uncharacterized protein (TIGR02145 family)
MKKATIALLLICTAAFAQQKGTFKDPRDGKTYKTTRIGDQTWMAENLNYDTEDSKCFDNKPANCAKYGRYYYGNTAANICPSGWMLPSEEEWQELVDFIRWKKVPLISSLKAKNGGWIIGNNRPANGTDDFGFSALPGGYNSDGTFVNFGTDGSWWGADAIVQLGEYSGNSFGPHIKSVDKTELQQSTQLRTTLSSVRCIQIDQAGQAARAAREAAEAAKISSVKRSSFTDSRDKKTYKAVKIGEQTWMAENLNYDANGSKCYDNKPENCAKYGRIYDRSIAAKICPSGWHLPDTTEWNSLISFAGGDTHKGIYVGNKFRAKSGWGWDGSEGGTDDYGFSALPGRGWWSATPGITGQGLTAIHGNIFYWVSDDKFNSKQQGAKTFRWSIENKDLISIRCIEDGAEMRKAEQAEAARVAALKSSFTDSRDKKTYKSVKIGDQIWMAENLNYDTKGSLCYENKPDNCKKYGRLYDWNTAVKICPSGWHLPNDKEWEALLNFAGSVKGKVAGKKFKAISGWEVGSNGTDDYGFSALPSGGYSKDVSQFFEGGLVGYWHRDLERGSGSFYTRIEDKDTEVRSFYNDKKSSLVSVRCVQGDAPKEVPAATPAKEPAKQPAPAPTPTPTPAPANNASTTMYCVIYMGGKLTTCTEMKDTKENKSTCDMQNKGLKLMRGEARWTAAKPGVKCGK